jgi:L-threonylcarbamoyladenylate synthase
MDTKLLTLSQNDIAVCGEILKRGGLVAIPTETVYGLAANAFDSVAVESIFKAKGRPQDNPLIVHICSEDMLGDIVCEIPENAKKLANAFWPGALTMILPKSEKIPSVVSANLNTVAVRFPSHKGAQAIIKAAGVPLAAPSANLSGSPSPTTFSHVKNDMFSRIDAIVDGGDCEVGVESTVISLVGKPKLLRPGGVTAEQIQAVIGEIEIDPAVLDKLKDGDVVSSPGMKYRHYAPSSHVVLVEGDNKSYKEFIRKNCAPNVVALCFDEDLPLENAVSYGSEKDEKTLAHNLFEKLRELDNSSLLVYAHSPKKSGISLAVYNRLIRAASFEVIKL